MKGCIYLIVNNFNLKNGKVPFLYIGSKKDISKFDDYWSSSSKLLNDIECYGINAFTKLIIKECEFDEYYELINEETKIQKELNVIKSKFFYNVSLANPDFSQHKNTHTKNTIWVNNGLINKRILLSEYEKYKSKGFVKKRLAGNYMKSRIYINDGINTKAIPESKLLEYKNNGWVEGRLLGNQTGRVCINNGHQIKKVLKEELKSYLERGWVLGQKL
jgi:hypothetical protein